MKARFYFDVKFSKGATDAEGLASAMDNVIKCGMSALSDSWDEYGGAPKVGEVFVLDTNKAMEHAGTVSRAIVEYTDANEQLENEGGELGRMLAPVAEFLRQIAGKK
jgi:hypothetical protein